MRTAKLSCAVVMSNSGSQATGQYSYNIESSQIAVMVIEVRFRMYRILNCRTSGELVHTAWRSDMCLIFSDMSDTELGAASQAFDSGHAR